MQIKDMAPWNWGKKDFPVASGEGADDAFHALQRRMNDAFDDFFRRFSLPPFDWAGGRREAFAPRVNVTQKGDVVTVEAEVPGLDEKELDVQLSDNVLTLRGERKQEHTEEDGERYYRREISYGAFQRSIPLPRRVKAEEVKATFRKGVLRVELPLEHAEHAAARRIAVKAE